MGDPTVPRDLFNNGLLVSLVGFILIAISYLFNLKFLLYIGLPCTIALPYSLTYMPESIKWYTENGGGHCPYCGHNHKLNFYSA
jgi:hypothetical protein